MQRRRFISSSLTIAPLLVARGALAAVKPVFRIGSLWVEGVFTANTAPGTKRGVLHFRVNGGAEKTLTAYVNDHPANNAAGKRECVELIKRYAAILGFAGYPMSKITSADDGNKLTSLGDGVDAAKRFAAESNYRFTYYTDGATDLPKTGSVLSTRTWTGPSGIKVSGHVGIVCNYDPPKSSTSSVAIKLFDQNVDGQFKDVVFVRKNGRWTGSMTMKGVNVPVAGWASFD